jgi:hypothetical protein
MNTFPLIALTARCEEIMLCVSIILDILSLFLSASSGTFTCPIPPSLEFWKKKERFVVVSDSPHAY